MKRYLLTTVITSFCLCNSIGFSAEAQRLELESLFEKTDDISNGNRRTKFSGTLTNKKGEVVFLELSEQIVINNKLYHWRPSEGLELIDIRDALLTLGYEPIKFGPDAIHFNTRPIHLDDNGNVFIKFEHKPPEPVTEYAKTYKSQYKLGVWNKSYGFKIIELPKIDDFFSAQFSSELIIVKGKSNTGYGRIAILKNQNNFWDNENSTSHEQTIETVDLGTPWEEMPLGDIGARLYAIEQLYKHPKSKKERNHIAHVVESEAAHVLDVLQYQAKKADYLINKANQEGVENPQAEKDYNDAMDSIEFLRKMMKDMPIKKTKAFSLDLPSNNWVPQEKNN